jgi:hypothetical protein
MTTRRKKPKPVDHVQESHEHLVSELHGILFLGSGTPSLQLMGALRHELDRLSLEDLARMAGRVSCLAVRDLEQLAAGEPLSEPAAAELRAAGEKAAEETAAWVAQQARQSEE